MKMRSRVSFNYMDTSLFYVYILECSDKTLYTGWTKNIEKRIQEHNHGKVGARYTRSRRPVKPVYIEVLFNIIGRFKTRSPDQEIVPHTKTTVIERQSPFFVICPL